MQVVATSTLHAPALIPLPNLLLDPGGYEPIVFKLSEPFAKSRGSDIAERKLELEYCTFVTYLFPGVLEKEPAVVHPYPRLNFFVNFNEFGLRL